MGITVNKTRVCDRRGKDAEKDSEKNPKMAYLIESFYSVRSFLHSFKCFLKFLVNGQACVTLARRTQKRSPEGPKNGIINGILSSRLLFLHSLFCGLSLTEKERAL